MVLFLCALFVSGCGDFFSEKETELESRNIIREISEVDYAENTDLGIPEIYTQKPKIVETKVDGSKDAKLFYFTRHHTPDKLATLINEQYIKKFRDPKGKTYPVRDYSVSVNTGANQLIVRCPSLTEAEEIQEFLEYTDVPPIQVKIDCIISEVYADHTMDWETTLDIQNLLGEGIGLGGKGEGLDMLPAFPGAALRDVARATFGLKAGYILNEGVDGHEFRALVDLLVSRGYLKILMNPTLEVVNGKTATIETSEHVPIDEISHVHPVSGAITKSTEYIDVVDSLEITPTVYADGYIGIKTKAIIGSKSTPEGVKQVPIVTMREINIEENRIRSGESLVIGGITKSEKRSVVRGVPFLKDIPIIGVLFSSKDFEERGKEVLFILTPTISTGGIPNEKLIDDLKDKHKMIKLDHGFFSTLTDPLKRKAYDDYLEIEDEETVIDVIEMENIPDKKSHIQLQIEKLRLETERIKMATEKIKANSSEKAKAAK